MLQTPVYTDSYHFGERVHAQRFFGESDDADCNWMMTHVPPRKKKPAKKSAEEITLESAMEELTVLVSDLESGQQPLSEALEKFERGMLLLKECNRQLDVASGRIEIVRKMTEEGVEAEPFDATATIDRSNDSSDDSAGSLF